MDHTSKSFPQFSDLPPELRLDIIAIIIEDAVKAREEWHRNRGSSDTIVVQPRPLGLPMKPPHNQPPSLAQLACVSTEWQKEIEKRLFKSLRLASPPGRGIVSHLIAFSAVVTGARRGYVRKLELESRDEFSGSRWTDDDIVSDYPKGCSFKLVMDLFRTLGTWGPVQDAHVPLTVDLKIELQDLPLQHFKEHIETLPLVPVVENLHINMHPKKFSKSPPALPFLLRKLPLLKRTALMLGPWCFPGAQSGNEEDSEVQAFADDLCSATPRLESLTLGLPRISRDHPSSSLLYGNILGGRFVSSIRELSYRLKHLELITAVDMSLFFEHFAHETKDRKLATYPSWPNLEILTLEGSITKRGGAEAGQPEDQFLRRVGRATRFMPKLQFLGIQVMPGPSEYSDQMAFWLERESYTAGKGHTELEEFKLWVMSHTPSSSAVSAWRNAALHSKRGHLDVHFMPAVSFDEDGEEIDDEEIDVEEIDDEEIDVEEIEGEWQTWGE